MGILKNMLDIQKGKIPKDLKRSSQWKRVRDAWLTSHPTCAGCGETKKLEVHHIKPFAQHPELELELDPSNLITLCETASNGIVCHQNLGHNGDYKDCNPNVVEDAAKMLERLTGDKK